MIKTDDKCIICGSSSIKKRKAFISPFLIERMFNNKAKNAELLICKNCKLHFFLPRPSDDEASRFYEGYMQENYTLQRQKYEYGFYSLRKNYENNFWQKEISFRKNTFKNILTKYTDISNIKTVLEYGGDKGQYIIDELANARRFVYEISAIKPVEGVKKIDKFEDLKKNNWDLIMCGHVLEHLAYPGDIMRLFSSILNKNGLLYIELPFDRPYVMNIKQEIKRLLKPSYLYPYMHEHINYFCPETIKKMMEINGLKILETRIIKTHLILGQIKSITCLAKKEGT